MQEVLISMFIDDQLSLDEKIVLVEKIHADQRFKQETVILLEQEKLLRSDMVERLPEVNLSMRKQFPLGWLKPVAMVAATVAVLFLIFPVKHMLLNQGQSEKIPHRFVIYLPDVSSAAVVGCFTGWQPVPMHKIGTSGYWVLNLELPAGEYRYTYVIENRRLMPDPTVSKREMDDFGGQNSILEVKRRV